MLVHKWLKFMLIYMLVPQMVKAYVNMHVGSTFLDAQFIEASENHATVRFAFIINPPEDFQSRTAPLNGVP